MKSTLLHVRRLAVATALLGVVFSPRAVSAQSELDASEAEAFLGSWTFTLESDFGPIEFPLELEDQGGKVAANVGSPDPSGGLTAVTDITRSGEDLVLRYDFDAQGQSVLVSLTLTPNDEGLLALFEIGDGAFSAGGTGTRVNN